MSLDIYLKQPHRCPHCGGELDGESREVFWQNITHNLGRMWVEAGVYDALYESEGQTAAAILPALRAGLAAMKADPPRFQQHDSPNGWGLYIHAVPWLERLVSACEEYPQALIEVSR